MRQRLLIRSDIHKIMNVLQKDVPAVLLKLADSGELFVKVVDYDDFVVALNDLVYKVNGGEA